MKRVVLAVTNDTVTDQRVGKMAMTLKESGFDPLICGIGKKNNPDFSLPWASIHRLPKLFSKGFLFYAEANIRLFLFLIRTKTDLIIANDLDTLLPCYLTAVLRRKKLVYDTHEYFTGTPDLLHRPIVRNFWKTLERIIFPRLNTIITVNESIAKIYFSEYGKPLHVVRNLPPLFHPGPDLDAGMQFPVAKHVLVLQGTGINTGRGAEEAIKAMLPEYGLTDALLLIIGGGNAIEGLKKMCSELNLRDRVHFLPRMPWQQMMQFTSRASIGLSLDKDLGLNQKYSLPNKLFDYIMAGIPVLASDLPEVRKIIETHKVGVVQSELTPGQLAKSILQMLNNPEDMLQWKENCLKASKTLCWENEKEIVKKIYSVFS